MNTRHAIFFALGLGLQACGAATETDAGPELPRVEASELLPVEVAGPILRCGSAGGQLSCALAVQDGFRVSVATVLVQSPDHVEEIGFFGDAEVAELAAGAVVAEMTGPITLDIQLHFSADSIASPDSTKSTDVALRCQLEIGAGEDVVCDAGAYERWNVYVVPDADVAAAWAAGKYGTPSVQTTVISESQDASVCFHDYPDCDAESLAELWDEVPDASGAIPDAIHYAVTLPREEAVSSVSMTTNVRYSPATVDGPGIYVAAADGSLTRQ